jgi:hypothetical protein
MTTPVSQEEYKPQNNNFTPISPLNAAPYTVQAIDAPIYLEPVFKDMTAIYVYKDNATVYSVITDTKVLAYYEIDPIITYRYKVKMDIVLDNGLCASTWFWNGKNTGWSELNYECNQNYPVYNHDEAMMYYGDYSVGQGDNFTVTFPRSGSVYLEWNVR